MSRLSMPAFWSACCSFGRLRTQKQLRKEKKNNRHASDEAKVPLVLVFSFLCLPLSLSNTPHLFFFVCSCSLSPVDFFFYACFLAQRCILFGSLFFPSICPLEESCPLPLVLHDRIHQRRQDSTGERGGQRRKEVRALTGPDRERARLRQQASSVSFLRHHVALANRRLRCLFLLLTLI